MRIESLQPSARGFWRDIRRWLGSRSGTRQFLLAAAIGSATTIALWVAYDMGALGFVESPVRALLVNAKETARADLATNDLPTLYLDIAFQEYQALAAQRDEALKLGILLLDDAAWQPAEIRFQEETIPVRIRLKGDWLDHLEENKWSFRIDTRRGAVLMGMRSFSVQSPSTRGFLNEWLFLAELRRAGILAPRYSFVNVVVNGRAWGVYALEESFSKELLESQGRREGVIVRFGEDRMWERRGWSSEEEWRLNWDPAATFESVRFAEVDSFNTTTVQSDPVLRQQAETALGLLRGFQDQQLSPSQVFDTELMGRYLAYSALWGAGHGLVWHNERYYYNALTARLEPIGFDADALELLQTFPVGLVQYEDLEIAQAFARGAARIARPEYLVESEELYRAEFERYYAALLPEFGPENLSPPWEALAARQAMLAAVFVEQVQTVYAHQVNVDQDITFDVQVGNILGHPVALRQVRIGEQTAGIRRDWVTESAPGLLHEEAEPLVVLRKAQAEPRYVTLQIPMPVIQSLLPEGISFYTQTVQIATNVSGLEGEVLVSVRRDYPPVIAEPILPASLSVEESLTRYPFLAQSDEAGFLELEPGTWEVEGDLVLPEGYGLRAAEAVTLKFDTEAIFLSHGPLSLAAPDEELIKLGPKNDHWAGLVVLQAKEESVLRNVEIRGTTGISREGWTTTGGVTFYESPVAFTNCFFLDSVAEDALNVLRSDFQLVHVEFTNVASDAFDGDFVRGQVTASFFQDVRGDAIDVSGSVVSVLDTDMLRIRDKGISAGEASVIEVTGVRLKDVSIGIASKDLSLVTAKKVVIRQAAIAGLAAYLKKSEYGAASIEATDVVFQDGSPQTLVQTGSSVKIDGQAATTTDLDVDDLYARLEALALMHRVAYQLGPAIRLLGYYAITPELNPGDDLRILLRWEADAKIDKDYRVFVHVRDASERIVAQRDAMPRDNTFRTTAWPVNQALDDLHTVPLPPDMPPGEYELAIGMYYWEPGQPTGDRLPVLGPNDEMIPDGAILLEPGIKVSN